jgi:Uma2 family endonuclease
LTTEEYLRTPETLLPQELIYGFVRDAAAPAPRHQSVVLRLVIALVRYMERHPVGQVWPAPIDVILDRERDLIVQPDLIVICTDRLSIVTDRVWGAPDLVVEVLSPHPRIGRLDERLQWFARYGVRECWLVHQFAREIEVLEFADRGIKGRRTISAGAIIPSSVLPEFDLPLEDILPPGEL